MDSRVFHCLILLGILLIVGCEKRPAPSTTALHQAAWASDIKSIELLISGGADVNARDWHGCTPLHRAAAHPTAPFRSYYSGRNSAFSRDVVAVLIGHGARVNAKDEDGRTPLHCAVRSGDADVVRILVDGGADTNAADRKGSTPLHIVAGRGLTDIADLLIIKGGKVDARDNTGCTPLHVAAAGNQQDMIELLLAKGADINATDVSGRTPVERAAQFGNFATVEFLVSRGAKLAASRDGSADDPAGAMVALAQGNSAFACDLYQQLHASQGNLFFCPYSISAALAMTYAGARGDTERQTAQTLRFTLAQQDLHPAMASLQAWLGQIQKQGSVRLYVANSLWPQQGWSLLQEYLSLTKRYYGVTITPVDYVREPKLASSEINHWVEERTEHKITDLIRPEILNELTRLVLVNAVYFKGLWKDQFDPRRTTSQPFHVSAETTVTAPLMTQTAKAGYAELDAMQVLALPYRGDSLSMLVVLPARIDGLQQIEDKLSVEDMGSWRGQLRVQKVHIFLPKFTMTCQFSLKSTLANMGMPDAFSLPQADFSGMTGSRELFISAAVHKAFVEVNEEGTEAAASTGSTTTKRRDDEPPTFRADHPFLFLIQENHTGSILFMGRVTDPTQTGS
jgi:serpin B